jgi:quercetin dioxygenase-like cupin family protein
MTFLLTGAETGGRSFVMEQVVPRHVRPPGLHRHANEDHVWYVQSGGGRFWVGDTMTEAGPGAVLWGPRGVPHAFSADSEELRVLVVTLPAGLEAFFAEIGEPTSADAPAPPGWTPPVHDEDARAARYGIELLGPEPRWTPRPLPWRAPAPGS